MIAQTGPDGRPGATGSAGRAAPQAISLGAAGKFLYTAGAIFTAREDTMHRLLLLLCLLPLLAACDSGSKTAPVKPGPQVLTESLAPEWQRVELPSEAVPAWREALPQPGTLVLLSIHPFLQPIEAERAEGVKQLVAAGKREDFDRSKLERSIRIAMQKRPIEPERIEHAPRRAARDAEEGIGAFMICAAAIALAGWSGLFERVMDRIPQPIAAALLAGVLTRFALDAFAALRTDLALVGGMFIVYLLGRRLWSRYAVPVVLLAGLAIAAGQGQLHLGAMTVAPALPVWTSPEFTLRALVGLALPLFVVTMASQNLPGVAAQRAAGVTAPYLPWPCPWCSPTSPPRCWG